MGKRIKHAAIPRGNDRQAIASLTSIAETLTGAKGDRLEKAVTFRDLEVLDIIEIKRSLNGREIFLENPTFNDPGSVVDFPSQPTGFVIFNGFTSILLSWDFPSYAGHAFTEVFRAEENIIGTAARLITSNGVSFSDIPGNNFTGYYWIRHVNQNGVAGPYNATSGLLGETAEDIEFNLSVLNGRLEQVHFASFLSDRIDLIQVNADAVAALDTLVDANKAAADSEINTINTVTIPGIQSSTNAAINTINTVTIPGVQASIQVTIDAIDAKVIDVQTVTIPAINQQITNINNLFPGYATLAYANSTFFNEAEVNSAISGGLSLFFSQVIQPGYVSQALLTNSYRTEANTDTAITQAIDTQYSTVIQPNFVTSALLTTDYRTASSQDTATTNQINTALSTIDNDGLVTLAFLESDYRTAVTQDTATTTQINTAISQIDYSGFATTAALTSDYRTAVAQDTATTNQINTALSTINNDGLVTLSFLQSDYRTAVTQDTATTTQINTAISQIDYSGFATTALLTNDYRTSVAQDTATTTQINTAVSAIDYSGFATTALLTSDYRTAVTQDTATTNEINSAISAISYSGFATTATLTNDYRTAVSQDSATTLEINNALSAINYSGFATTALLSSDYRTAVSQDTATTLEINNAISQIDYSGFATTAFIQSDYRTSVAQDTATTTALNTFLSATITPTYATNAFITNNYITETDTDSAIGRQVSGLRGEIFSGNGNVLQSAFVNNLDSALSNSSGSIATSLSNLTATLNNPSSGLAATAATVTSNQQAIVNDTGGIISSKIDSYTTTANGETNSLAQWAQVASDAGNSYEAQWGVKTNVNGLQGGVGFYNNGTTTQLTVDAERFAVIDSTDNSVKSIFTTIINDPVLPDGVYIDTAFIKVATIADLVVGDINADTVTAGISIQSALLTGGRIVAGELHAMGGSHTFVISPTSNYAMWYGSRFAYTPGGTDNRADTSVRFALRQDGSVIARGMTIYNNTGSEKILDINSLDGAFIKDLSVETLSIAGNAITASVSALTARTSGSTIIQTLSVTTAGGSVEIIGQGYIGIVATGGGSQFVYLRLYRGTTLLKSITVRANSNREIYNTLTAIVVDTPAAGTYDYTLRRSGFAANVSDRYLSVREFKK